jgi:hypothetical protein
MIRQEDGTRGRQAFFTIFILLLGFGPLERAISAQSYLYNQAVLAVGNKPSSIAVVDLNGDGRLDVAVANQSDNTVSVVLGRADGSFTQKVDYKVGAAPVALASGDFNGDHLPDLAVVNSQDNTVSILLGAGNGTFNPQVTYPTGILPVAIVTADFNGDTKRDLAIANQNDGTVSILLGNGDGTFQSQTKTAVVSAPIAIASGDFDGDGTADVVALNGQGALSLLLNNGNGGFTAETLSIGPSSGGMAIGDLNNDGNLDIVVTNPVSDEIVTLLGDGRGGFQSLATSMGPSPVTVAVGDFNQDGKLDLAVGTGNGFPSSISVLLGNGDGTYQQPSNTGFTGTAAPMMVGDFNNDNYLDLAAIDTIDNQIVVFLGSGNGSLGGHTDLMLPASGGVAGSAVADFNGDGKLDLAVAQFNQNGQGITGFVAVVPSNGNGTFKPPISTTVSNIGIGPMVAGDFNGDGKADIATAFIPATGGISVLLGNGDGTFANPTSSPVNLTLNVQNMIGGDFNNDGKTDLALLSLDSSNTFSPLYILLSNGDGTFQPKLVENVPGIATSLAAGDFNHDGNLDIAVTDPQGANPSVLVFLGRGDGTFTGPASYSTGTLFTNDVKSADFNGDGHMDLAVSTEQGIFYFAGNGDGTFQAPVKTSMPFSVIRTSVGDFNGDGKPDMAMTGNGNQSVSIAIGNGDGTFQAPFAFEATYYPRGFLTAGDFNGDGSFDLMQFSAGNTLNVSPQTASTWLSTPTVVFSASRLDFGTQAAGTSSSPMSIALTNQGNMPLGIARITTSGNFTETDNCISTFTVGQGCTLTVIFTPTANGASQGSLTVADNAGPGHQTLALTGWTGPPDFSLVVGPTSQSVAPGGMATYSLTLAAGGGFSGTVQLRCTGAPSNATCALSKSSLTIDASSPATVKVTVTTAASSMTTLSTRGELLSLGSSFPRYWMICFAPIATLLLAGKRRTVTRIGFGVLALSLVSCGGSTSGGGGGGGNAGTPPGTYSLTLSGASGSTTHTVTITLTVT